MADTKANNVEDQARLKGKGREQSHCHGNWLEKLTAFFRFFRSS